MASSNEDLDLGEEKKSSRKWIILGGLVILLLAGGGAGMYFMGLPPFGGGEETAEPEEDEAETEKKPSGPKEAHFQQFAPLLVNFPRGSGARLMQVEFSVLTYDEASNEAVRKHAPMIRNNLLLLLGRYKPQDLRTAQGKLALREAIQGEVQKVLDMQSDGAEIEAVFFTKFLME